MYTAVAEVQENHKVTKERYHEYSNILNNFPESPRFWENNLEKFKTPQSDSSHAISRVKIWEDNTRFITKPKKGCTDNQKIELFRYL